MTISLKNKFKLASFLIAIAIITILLVNQHTLSKIRGFSNVQKDLLTLKADILTLRRNEKDFISRKDLKYWDQFSANAALLTQHLAILKAGVAEVNLESEGLANIDLALANYFKSFKQLVTHQKELGLNHRLGLYGSLRNTAHVTENEIRKQNNHLLLADLLQLRRNEKDFMLRLDIKYLDKFSKNLKLFKQHLKSSDLSDQLKQGFGNIIDFYQQDFLNFVEKSKERGLDSSSGLKGEMRKQIHSVENTLDSLYARLNSKVEQELGNIERFVLMTNIFGAATGGLVVLIMMWLSRSVLSPIKAIGSTIKKITHENDLSVRVSVEGSDEIAEIGQSFNHMLESIAQILFNVTCASNNVTDKTVEMSRITGSAAKELQQQQSQAELAATAMNEMSTTIQGIASSAEQAAKSATYANEQSIKGKNIVALSSQTIGKISSEIITASNSIIEVAKDSERIGAVLEEIRGIADQTNLLALNAAIEAARAGEQGRGFAVVADEVRSLASRTQDSTQEIQEMVESLQSGSRNAVTIMAASRDHTELGVKQSKDANDALEKIVSAVMEINDMNSQIANATEQQAVVSEEIHKNIELIHLIALKNATNNASFVESNTQINQMIDGLNQMLATFK